MEELNKIEIRSEEVQDILSRPPRWIIRWGVSVLFAIILLLLVGSYFYKYPDIIQSQITISTLNPPASILAISSGKIVRINAIEGQSVDKGFILAEIENTACFEDILQLHAILDSLKNPIEFKDSLQLKLGELQPTYSAFQKMLKDFKIFTSLSYYDEKIKAVYKQKADYQLYYDRLWTQRNIQENQLKLATSQFERDKSLFEKNVLTKSEYEKSEKTFLSEKMSFENARSTLANTQMQINQLDQQVLDLELQKNQDEKTKISALEESFQNLKSQLKKWEQTYFIISPIAGKVTFTQIWSVNQNIQAGEIVATIIPQESMKIIGKVMIPAAGAGKVKAGQMVNVKVNNYPYMEFGMLKARIRNISLIPITTKDAVMYVAEVEFPNGLITNYNKKLELSQQMTGTAEVITMDKRLIERLVEPLEYFVKKN